jgi:hypothetical protein
MSAAQNMEELIVPIGTVLIKQDDVGDSVGELFFIRLSCRSSMSWKKVKSPSRYVVQLPSFNR